MYQTFRTMATQIITLDDLDDFRLKLLDELKDLLNHRSEPEKNKWLKSVEVMNLLNISKNTLHKYRENGVLYGKKVGGIYLYGYQEIQALLSRRQDL